jgi:hypothetical protein
LRPPHVAAILERLAVLSVLFLEPDNVAAQAALTVAARADLHCAFARVVIPEAYLWGHWSIAGGGAKPGQRGGKRTAKTR